MLEELPVFIDPKRLSQENGHLKGKFALAQMERLHADLCEIKGNVYIDWSFAFDEHRHPTIQGRVQAQLSMYCQRCLQPMEWAIDAEVALVILAEGQEEEDLPTGYEVLTLTKTPVSLITLIEDELILALPLVAKHAVCPSNEYQLPETFSKSEKHNFQPNPFQVLSELKKPH